MRPDRRDDSDPARSSTGCAPDDADGENPPPAETVEALARDLQVASDSVVLRVTGLLDRLPLRGDVDLVLDGVRPRLNALRPARRRTLARVLFEPFDPVIVDAAAWRPNAGAIPRSIIAPVMALVRARLSYAGHIETDLASGGEPGPQLWSDSAKLLTAGAFAKNWRSAALVAETGIAAATIDRLCEALRLLFSHEPVLRTEAAGQEPDTGSLQPLLLAAARCGPIGYTLVVSLLLEQTGSPARMVQAISGFARESSRARALETALQGVIGAVVDRLDRPPGPPAADDAGLIARARLASRIAGFGSLPDEIGPFGRKLTQRRQELAIRCREDLATGIEQVRAWSSTRPRHAAEAPALTARLDSRLRALKRLEIAARELGGTDDHDRMLRDAVAAGGAGGWLTGPDLERLSGIVDDPAAAGNPAR